MEIHENFELSCQMNFEPGEDQSGFYKILIIVMVLIVLSSSRTFTFQTEFFLFAPLKALEKCFLFHLKSSFRSQDI